MRRMGIPLLLFLAFSAQLCFGQFNKENCGTTKSCLFKPTDCTPGVDCAYAFSYRTDTSKAYFELLSQVPDPADAWVAVGFSTDNVMGRDSVVTCWSDGQGDFVGALTYNPGKSNRPVTMTKAVEERMIQTTRTNMENGTLYCQINRLLAPLPELNVAQVFDLRTPYFILLASGKLNLQGQVQVHSLKTDSPLFPFVSSRKIDITVDRAKREDDELEEFQLNLQPTEEHVETLRSVGTNETSGLAGMVGHQLGVTPQPQQQQQPVPFPNPTFVAIDPEVKYKSDLLKVHAILMCIAWLFFLPIGILFGQFFKRHIPNNYIFGKRIWFRLHQCFNMLGVACVIAAFVCIFVRVDWIWNGPKAGQSQELNRQWPSVHAMLGLLASVVAWAQPIGATLRCLPTSRLRFIFNIVHGFFGYGALLMAFSAIMIAAVHFDPAFTNRRAVLGIFIAFLCVFGLTFIALTALYLRQWWQRRRNPAAADMELVQSDGKTHFTLSAETIKTHRIMFACLAFFIACSIGATVAITILIGLKSAEPMPI